MTSRTAIRRTLAIGAAIAIAILVVRSAVVEAFAESDPVTAAKLWSGHPQVTIANASRAIASAAGARKEIGKETFAAFGDAARKAPLEPQPFVVRGIQLQLAGQVVAADRAFLAARWRDPRALPTRYFLASSRLGRGNVDGLREVAALARMSPGGISAAAPYLATFARQPAALVPMRQLLDSNPLIRADVLATLAQDPANLKQVLELGGTLEPARAPWLATMITTLVDARQYERAQDLWARTAGIDRSRPPWLLYDPDFRDSTALPPFNWQLTSSAIGLAERRSSRLQVIYYGQADGVLARQLLVLAPGRYRFAAPATGAAGNGEGSALNWAVRCAGTEPALVLASAPAAHATLAFNVPSSCAAQWLELAGRASDIGRESEIAIGPVSLARIAAR